MGYCLASEKGNVTGESRSQSFIIRDDIDGEVEFDWGEWDDLMEIIEQLKQHKPENQNEKH